MVTSPSSLPVTDLGHTRIFFGTKNGKYPDGNQVIVRSTDIIAAFDTPLVSNQIGPEFDSADIVVLGHVHEDHMAGLHRVPNAAIHVPEADLAAAQSWEGLAAAYGVSGDESQLLRQRFEQDFHYQPQPHAIGYTDGMTWDLGKVKVHAIHMPGHTPGHSVLLIEPDGIAFIGDIDLSGFGPYYGDAHSSLSAFRQTLQELPTLPAKSWISFHHRGLYTDRQSFLEDLEIYISKIQLREERLLDLLRASPKTLAELVKKRILYPPDYNELWVEFSERNTIIQHLAELIEQGRVQQHGNIFEFCA